MHYTNLSLLTYLLAYLFYVILVVGSWQHSSVKTDFQTTAYHVSTEAASSLVYVSLSIYELFDVS